MPRNLRIGFEGALYHLLNRLARREPMVRDGTDRQQSLDTLGEACANTDAFPRLDSPAPPLVGWVTPPPATPR